MRKRRLLLAATALSTSLAGACTKKQKPHIYANSKGEHPKQRPPDAGVEAPDAPQADPPTEAPKDDTPKP